MKKGLKIFRDTMGIPHIEADNLTDMYWGNGYVHAKDRGMQMLLMRILGQGMVSEILDSSDTSLQIDLFFRRMNWSGNVKEQMAELDQEKKEFLQSYQLLKEEVLLSSKILEEELNRVKENIVHKNIIFQDFSSIFV